MSAPYISDEMPLMGNSSAQVEPLYLDIPSLERELFARQHGVTIYGSESEPKWCVSTTASVGNVAYSHWMKSRVSPLARLFSLIILKWIATKRVAHNGWIGKVILASDSDESEAHFLVYSEKLNASVDLNIQLGLRKKETHEKGLTFLDEIRPH